MKQNKTLWLLLGGVLLVIGIVWVVALCRNGQALWAVIVAAVLVNLVLQLAQDLKPKK